MKVLVCGSRNWSRLGLILQRLSRLPENTTIIVGAANGADKLAALVGRRLGFRVEEYPADWQKFGRAAGFKRNLQMLDQNPDLVIAFHLNKSPGTTHTIKNAVKRGIATEVIVETTV